MLKHSRTQNSMAQNTPQLPRHSHRKACCRKEVIAQPVEVHTDLQHECKECLVHALIAGVCVSSCLQQFAKQSTGCRPHPASPPSMSCVVSVCVLAALQGRSVQTSWWAGVTAQRCRSSLITAGCTVCHHAWPYQTGWHFASPYQGCKPSIGNAFLGS